MTFKTLYQRYGVFLAMCLVVFTTHHQLKAETIPDSFKQEKALVDVLKEIEENYQIFFTYEAELLQNVKVDYTFNPEESVEHAIDRVLSATGFQYQSYSSRFIVIFKDDKKGRRGAKKIGKKIERIQKLEQRNKISVERSIPQTREKFNTIVESVSALQQAITISGTVTDAAGEPLIGANILVKGTGSGTVTDFDGTYTLNVPDGQNVLIFSYTGYAPKEVEINGRTTIDITLEEDVEQLGEVVVIGYGTQRRKDLTGSVASVSSKELEQIPVASFDQKLQGQIAGVQVSQSTGAPGGGVTIRVRGTGSATSGNEPLYVVDGVPLSNRQDNFTQGFGFSGGATLPPMNPLATLNPSDIETINVLKDASATAIYGSRGANGVVIITTKKGRSGKPTVQVDVARGWQSVPNRVDVLNGQEMAELRVEARRNGWIQNGGDPAVYDADPTDVGVLGNLAVSPFVQGVASGATVSDTDWQDQIFRVAPTTNLQGSVRGGSDKTKYFVSANYFEQEGVIRASGFERFSARINVDSRINEKIKVGMNFAPSYAVNNIANTGGRFANGNVIMSAANLHSFLPVFDEDGNYVRSRSTGFTRGAMGPVSNPIALTEENQIKLDQGRIIGNANLSYEPIAGLTLKTSVGTDLNFFRTNIFESQFRGFQPGLEAPAARASSADELTWLIENTVTYNKAFGNGHNLNILAGQTAQKATLQRNTVERRELPNDDIPFPTVGVLQSGTAEEEEWSLVSYLARANYSFKGKYLLTASIRTDGSSRFSSNNRFGTFPSFAVGWNVKEEDFMQNLNWLDALKLRGSWGRSGNFEISNYASFARIDGINYASGDNLVQGIAPITAQNDDLTWETTTQTNFGIDISLFNARVNVTADYYDKNTTDMLLITPIPTVSGFSTAIRNLGEVENKGWEFTLSTINIERKDFSWETSFNISHNDNTVLALGGSDDDELIGRDDANLIYKTVVGRPISQLFGYVSDGIFMSEEEVAAHAFQRPSTAPGDRRFVDLNDDGVINADDQTFIGDPNPDYIFGFTNTIRYKGLDFSFLFSGMQGNDILNVLFRGQTNGNGNLGQNAAMLNRWRSESEPGDGNTHRAIFGVANPQNDRVSSYYVEDGSFIRLRNVSLGYTFTKENPWLDQANIQQIRVYATGTNLFILDNDFRGFDPEINSRGNNPLVQGSNLGGYPLPRIFTVGLSATF